ncbi:MAG TPA: DUF3854 domain-containing protein [Candidatus Dormibacteraeota bacterium]|nr:DUF3854 domain-containing protein [Candidatus Dormibacteraeota bacterium]
MTAHSTTTAAWTVEQYQAATDKLLLPQHLAQLLASGISLEVAVERGYYSATTKVALSALGFPPSQQLVPALVVPLWSVDEEVALYQLRPDDPRRGLSDSKVIKYETPKGAGLRLDVHPRMRQFLGDPERPLFSTEGIKKVDAATTNDLCTIGLLGVSGWRGRNQNGGVTALADWAHVHLKARRVYVVFDSDVMTKMAVYDALLKFRTWLESKGAEVLVVYLPSGSGGAKVGLDDYLAAGHSRDELMALAGRDVIHPDSTEPGAQTWSVGEYAMDARHGTFRRTLDGDPRKLANFCARIVRKSFDDDGDPLNEKTGAEELEAIHYKLEIQKGRRDATIEVTAAEFKNMTWTSRVRRLDLIVSAGQQIRDQMREAIEQISEEAARQQGIDLIPQVTTFTHLGWSKGADGASIYLHCGGAIGAAGLITDVSVRLPVELSGYKLPAPPTGDQLISAVRASLALLDLGPDKLMVPVLGAVYRSVLGPADFAVHIFGPSGAFKTEGAKLALAHQCECKNSHDLSVIQWSSTGNSLEGLLHHGKDALVVVDDLLPAGLSPREREHMLDAAARVLRAQGNQGGRSRMRADSTIRPPKAPRGLAISTGEELPRGLSGLARVWLIEQREGDVTSLKLTAAQAQALLYSMAMSAYLQRLAPQMSGMGKRIREERDTIRATYPASHSRTSEIAAHIELGWKVWLEFAVSCGAITAQQASGILGRVREALLAGCQDQVEEQGEANPVELYRHGLQAAISSGRVYIEGLEGQPPPDPGSWGWVSSEYLADAELDIYRPTKVVKTRWDPANRQGKLGWLDGANVYLLPEVAYKAAGAQVDGGLGIGQATLNKRLREDGVLASVGEGKNIPRKAPRAIHSPGRVLHFHRSFLVGSGNPSPDPTDPTDPTFSGERETYKRDACPPAGADSPPVVV